jgi:GNAT superfamily N-acetyltransferase
VSDYEPSLNLLEAHGMKAIRKNWRMVIELNDEIPLPKWPGTISIRTFQNEKDAEALYRADVEAFSDHWGFIQEPFDTGLEKWKHHMLNEEGFDPSLWILAMDGAEIAGAALCRHRSWEEPDSGWVRSLFVRRPWRRQGIALGLLHHVFHEFRKRGKKAVGLGVDSENLTGATRLYEKAGMKINREHVLYELELKQGVELGNSN